jgi:hypothetical protein
LAHAIVGIEKGVSAEDAYGAGIKINLSRIKRAIPLLGMTFPVDDLQFIFADYRRSRNADPQPPLPIGTSARMLRNYLVHDFGPTNVNKLAERPASLIAPKMVQFLACTKEVIAHLKRNWP